MSDTLSPTPPVECLSSSGLSTSQLSTLPESRIAVVSVTRSAGSRSRKKTAIANAAACPSVTVPSVIPPTSHRSSSSVRLAPSRFRRISSWAKKVIGDPASSAAAASGSGSLGAHPPPQQRPERGGALLPLLEGLLVGEGGVAHPLGEVCDDADRRDPQPAVGGDDRLGHRAHPDEVGAERLE